MSMAQMNSDAAPFRRTTDAAHQPIAIVGIGCRLPGGIDTPTGPRHGQAPHRRRRRPRR
ncbi:hypothetical protein ACFVRD_38640 [Streptomyces sp. NPDC057908]|uniref:hypothetical protein n=1 Tax=Streptomyces sp. NPDC057908 TaxID=3346276 RepID=UPI0036F03C16